MKKHQKERIWSLVTLAFLLVATYMWTTQIRDNLPWLVNQEAEQQDVAMAEIYIPEGATVLEVRQTQHRGWDGYVPFKIILSEDGKILSLNFLPNRETPAWISMIENGGFMNSWNGLTLCEAVAHPVDAMSGATITTVAVINSLRDEISQRIERGELICDDAIIIPGRSAAFYIRLSATLAVLAFALFSFFFPKRAKPVRLYLLALSVIVLGVWQNQYLSVEGIFNRISGGFLSASVFGLMLILAFILPLITRKQFYCTYVCPYGAAQELIAKLNKKRIQIPQKTYKILVNLRPAYLLVIILLLFTGLVTDFVNFEPFAGFMLSSFLWFPMILAGFFLLISLFVPKFWCKYCCPTGYIIDLAK